MIALIDVELRRAFARRLTRFAALLALVGITTAAVIVFFRSSDAGAEAITARERQAFEQCVRSEFPPDFPPELIEQHCRVSVRAFSTDPRYHLSSLRQTYEGLLVPLVILAWLLAASLVGAEWRAGTATTQLTWEPRRIRVMVAKGIAAIVLGVAFYLAIQVVLSLFLLPSAIFRGTTDHFDLAANARFLLRGTLLAAVGSMIGFSLGAIGRNTTLAMAAGFIYLAVLEGGLLGGFFPGLRRWLIVGNSLVFMTGVDGNIPGRGQTAAGLLLLAYGLAAVALATWVFRARDVTN